MKVHDNQHFWTIIAQCKNPYREFSYCERCHKYQDGLNGVYGKVYFRDLVNACKADGNPMYEPDSNKLLEF